MEKRLELYKDFILENTGKDTYFYLSSDIVSDFFVVCKSMNYSTPKVVFEDYYDISNINNASLETETLYRYEKELEFKKVEIIQTEIENLYTKILQIGEEQFELKLTKTAIEHLKLTGKCKIL